MTRRLVYSWKLPMGNSHARLNYALLEVRAGQKDYLLFCRRPLAPCANNENYILSVGRFVCYEPVVMYGENLLREELRMDR